MTDTELVYALYVQANPVPDPDALPLRQAEAELLMYERSLNMDTRDTIEVRPSPKVGPRRRGLVFGLAAIMVVAAVGVGAYLIAGDGSSPVAAADAFPDLVFDGTACRYDGPALIERGTAEIRVVNTSPESIGVVAYFMLESRLDAELERSPLGTDWAASRFDPAPSGDFFVIMAPARSEATRLWSIIPGTYLIECGRWSDPAGVTKNNFDHVWRADKLIEVVAPSN